MTFRVDCFELLDHLGPTATIRDLHANPQRDQVVGLRHDIDHSLDLALELAHHEHARGMQATYFLLHTHPYTDDPLFIEKCRQLVDYGHEIGIHVNSLTEWMTGKVDDPVAPIAALLERLRGGGIDVVGAAAHGDRACYAHGFSNVWLWKENRGDDPARTEAGRAAEGIATSDPDWQLPYPADHRITRADGRTLELWGASLAEHGLQYEAVRIQSDHYWTDSGGSWARSGDPMQADLARGRHQVLVHPIWWRGDGKLTFVMSTARCATKWLTERLETATSARALHEWSLNHRRDVGTKAGYIAEKRTHEDFRWFEEKSERTTGFIKQAIRHHQNLKSDVVECNVYLAFFAEQLRELCPDAQFVHVHRDAGDVVRSILQRGWYASPDDRRRPRIRNARWRTMTQLERACLYWADVNERLLDVVPEERRFAIENLYSDPEAFADFARSLGLVVHPRLLGIGFSDVRDRGPRTVPPVDEWNSDQRGALGAICNDVLDRLGRTEVPGHRGLRRRFRIGRLGRRIAWKLDRARTSSGAAIDAQIESLPDGGLAIVANPPADHPEHTKRNAHAVLAKGTSWSSGPRAPATKGYEVVSGHVRYRTVDMNAPRLFILFFGQDGEVERKQVATLRDEIGNAAFVEPIPESTQRVALAVHLGEQTSSARLEILEGALELLRTPRGYTATFT